MIPRSKFDVWDCLRLGDVVIIDDVLTVHFRHFKHSVKHYSQTLRVKRTLVDGTSIDPFDILQEFLIARGRVQAPVCSRPDGTPMVRHGPGVVAGLRTMQISNISDATLKFIHITHECMDS